MSTSHTLSLSSWGRCVPWGWVDGYLGQFFAGYVLLASQKPYPITVYSVAIYRCHLIHFWAIKGCNTKIPENERAHSDNYIKNTWKCNPITVSPVMKMPPYPAAHQQHILISLLTPPPPPPGVLLSLTLRERWLSILYNALDSGISAWLHHAVFSHCRLSGK